ncbi:MAG: hypothetical protein ABEJ95_07345 [Candidatus Nanohalobium sp.]
MLGQSAVEYLTTYGWMVIAVSMVSAVAYPALDRGCSVEVSDDIGGDLTVEGAGVSENGTFKVVLDSDTAQEVTVESLQLNSSEDSFEVVNPESVRPKGKKVYRIGEVEKTGSCDNFDVVMTYDKGPLKDQRTHLQIKGSLELVKKFKSLIREIGDSVTEIDIYSTVKPTEKTLCIGTSCPTTEGEVQGDEYVNYSGDEMTGTLKTGEIKALCYGVNCPTEKGDEDGYVNTEDARMNGTLNLTELKPLSKDAEQLIFK